MNKHVGIKEKSGFTLIELMVAATIIGLLTAIAVASYVAAQRKSRDSKRKADLESIRGALEMMKVDCGSYRATAPPWGASWSETCGGQTYTYMQKVPQDPKDSSIIYYYATVGSGYELCAYLESGGTNSCTGGANNCGSGKACNYKVTQP